VKSPATMLALAVLAISSLQAGDGDFRTRAPQDDLRQYSGPSEPEPPNTPVAAGDPAPDFSFETSDHRWYHLRDLLVQGSVMLVFAPTDAQMRALESERDALLAKGILPVAVLDRRDGQSWSTPDRLKLHYHVLADSRGVIAAQFNLVDTNTHRTMPGWFVVDRSGRVRGLRRETLPDAGYVPVAARALGLAEHESVQPASAH
jgi:peroxiredoxin